MVTNIPTNAILNIIVISIGNAFVPFFFSIASYIKDITNFSTSSDTEETPQYDPKQKKNILINVDSNRFALTVPGDKFYCSMEQNDYTERAIQGMKAKLREKKA